VIPGKVSTPHAVMSILASSREMHNATRTAALAAPNNVLLLPRLRFVDPQRTRNAILQSSALEILPRVPGISWLRTVSFS
jgi:hypothetical protein